jgi:hypothetical protein
MNPHRAVAQPGSVPEWGSGGRGFKSRLPDQLPHRAAMEQQNQNQTIRITLDDNVAQGEYINFANIIHSPSEFVIDLGRMVPGRPDVKIYSRAIMTPLHAKQLLEALRHNIALYEQKFGEIRVEDAQTFTANEPSN